MNEALQYIESSAKAKWDFSHSRNPLIWLLRFILGARPHVVVWITEHDAGDWDHAECTGAISRCWRYDDTGLTLISEVGKIDKRAIFSTTPVIRFVVDPKTQRMIYTEWEGLRAGHGTVLKLEEGKGWTMERPAWRS